MAITFVVAANAKNEDTANLSVTKPSGIQSGDVIVANLCSVQGATITNPTSFTTVLTQNASTGVMMRVAYKIATGSEPSSYTWQTSTSSQTLASSLLVFRGVAGSGTVRTSNSDGVAATSNATPSLTGVQSTDMVVLLGGARPESSSATNDTTAPGSPWTAPAAAHSGAGSGNFSSSTDAAYQINGTTGTFTTDVSSGIAAAGLALVADAGASAPAGTATPSTTANTPKSSIGAKAQVIG